MSDPRLSSPSSIRLVAAAAAAVASLGVVALGVQLGTSGLVGDGPGRNPGSSSATPASVSVDLPRSRPAATLEEQLVALVPAVGTTAFGSSSAAGATVSAPPAGDTAPAAPADGSTPAPAPAPSPVPTPPLPTPDTPAPTLPATPTLPTVPPVLDPVVDPVGDALSGIGAGPAPGESTTAEAPAPAPTTTLDGLIRLLLGP